MKLRSIVGALTWIAIAAGTLESDSRGNRSNEKVSNYEERAINDRTKEIVDDSPPILDTSESIERIVEPGNEKKSDNRLADKNAENREADKQPANEAVRHDALPSLTTRATERSVDETRKNVTTSTRSRANETPVTTEQILPRRSTATSDNSAGPDSESNDSGNPNSNEQSDLRSGADFGQRVRSLPTWRSRSNEDAGTARLGPSNTPVFPDNSRKQRGKKNVATKHVDASEYPFPNEGQELDEASSRNSLAEKYTGGVRNEDATGTSSREAPLSLGKFSGPIVVADLPRRTKYSFGKTEYVIAGGGDDDDDDERPDSKFGYTAALSNRPRGHDSNSLVNEPMALLDRPESSLSGTIDGESRNRPTESVASDTPRSVEIQKSLELFHTAPVHEIHYPLEFVPYVQRAGSAKKRPRQRPGQTNAYRTNEIPDGERYEYNANEDKRSALNSVTRPTDDKPAVDLPDDSEYDQTDGTYSRIERIPERVAGRNEFDPPKGIIANFLGIESSSAPGNLQDTPELLEDPSVTESSFLRRYPTEKLYPHRAINTDDGKPPNQSEKVIEKPITIPQPYFVHVPVDRVVEKQIRIPYPVHAEKLIEKKMPFAIQRLIVPIPVHFRIPQPIPIPIPIPVPVEKSIDDRPRARPSDAENVAPYPPENPKPANSFKQVPRPPNFRSPYENDYFNSTVATTASATLQFHGTGYSPVNRPFARQQQILQASPNNKFRYPQSILYTSSNDNNDNIVFYGRTFPEKDQTIDEYVGPVPRKAQPSLGMRSKFLQYAATDVQSTIRRTRQEGNIGAFRQSKMEYGFKPPMVPSIQYDEQTATKVD